MLCDSGYTIVGLRDFFQKSVCSLNGGLAAWGCPHKKKGELVKFICLLQAGPWARPPPQSPHRGRPHVPTVESRIKASPVDLVGGGFAPQGTAGNVTPGKWCHWRPAGGGQVPFSSRQSRTGLPVEFPRHNASGATAKKLQSNPNPAALAEI